MLSETNPLLISHAWRVVAALKPSRLESVATCSLSHRLASPMLIIWERVPKGIWISSKNIFRLLVHIKVLVFFNELSCDVFKKKKKKDVVCYTIASILIRFFKWSLSFTCQCLQFCFFDFNWFVSMYFFLFFKICI